MKNHIHNESESAQYFDSRQDIDKTSSLYPPTVPIKTTLPNVPPIGNTDSLALLSAYSIISRISLYFERTWTQARPFSIEDALKQVDSECRPDLFVRLLEIDMSLGIERGCPLPLSNYKERFPQWIALIDETNAQIMKQSVIIQRMRLGRKIGNYLIQDIIGKGGMGIVYKAFDKPFQRTVAIKYLLPSHQRNERSFEFFQKEIALMGQLPHGAPFAQAYSCDQDGDFHYLVMEYIEGVNLARYLFDETPYRKDEIGPLEWQEAVNYTRQIAEGLATIHKLNIIHRDIKPENVMLTQGGQIRILDLGLALLRDTPLHSAPSKECSDGQKKSNLSRETIGTLAYMSPESYHEPEKVDTRSDLYSLGGTLFFLLTGRLPSEWSSPVDKTETEPLEDFLKRNDIAIPHGLFKILAHLLERKQEDRYQTAEEVIYDLNQLQEDYNPLKKRVQKQKRLRSIILSISVSVFFILFLLIKFGGIAWIYYHKAFVCKQNEEYEKTVEYLEKIHPEKFWWTSKFKAGIYLDQMNGNLHIIQKMVRDRSNNLEQKDADSILKNSNNLYRQIIELEPDNIQAPKAIYDIYDQYLTGCIEEIKNNEASSEWKNKVQEYAEDYSNLLAEIDPHNTVALEFQITLFDTLKNKVKESQIFCDILEKDPYNSQIKKQANEFFEKNFQTDLVILENWIKAFKIIFVPLYEKSRQDSPNSNGINQDDEWNTFIQKITSAIINVFKTSNDQENVSMSILVPYYIRMNAMLGIAQYYHNDFSEARDSIKAIRNVHKGDFVEIDKNLTINLEEFIDKIKEKPYQSAEISSLPSRNTDSDKLRETRREFQKKTLRRKFSGGTVR